MKIEMLTLIEDALIGGRNGEMAWIENNPLIYKIYEQSEKSFKEFLTDCLAENIEKPQTQPLLESVIVKELPAASGDKLKEYANALYSFNEAKQNLEKAKKNLAQETSNVLFSVKSTYRFFERYDTLMVEYTIPLKKIQKINEEK